MSKTLSKVARNIDEEINFKAHTIFVLFQNEHPYWATVTALIIFAPFSARLLIILVQAALTFWKEIKSGYVIFCKPEGKDKKVEEEKKDLNNSYKEEKQNLKEWIRKFFKCFVKKFNELIFILPVWIFLEVFWGKVFTNAGRTAKEEWKRNDGNLIWQFPLFHPFK